MSTPRAIVRRALRLLGVIAAGKEPTGSQAADGLERLQGLILGLPGLLMNGVWHERATHAAYTAKEGERITVTAPGVVTLPTVITHCGRARPPQDLSRVQILGTATNVGLWIYSATNAAWNRADALTIADTVFPFGIEDEAGLAAMLAVDLSDEYGATQELGPRTVALASQAARSLRARFKKAEPTDWSRPEPQGPLEVYGDGLYPTGPYY